MAGCTGAWQSCAEWNPASASRGHRSRVCLRSAMTGDGSSPRKTAARRGSQRWWRACQSETTSRRIAYWETGLRGWTWCCWRGCWRKCFAGGTHSRGTDSTYLFVMMAAARAKKGGTRLAGVPFPRTGTSLIESMDLVRAASGRSAFGLAARLRDHAVKRSGGHEPSLDYADAVQRIPGVGSAIPTAAAVLAFEDHAGSRAGGEQTFAFAIVGDGADVLIRQPVHHVFPGNAGIGTAVSSLSRGDQNLSLRRQRDAANAGQEVGQGRLLPGAAAVRREHHAGAGGNHHELALGADADEVRLTHHRTARPRLAFVGAGEQSGRSSGIPAPGSDFHIADLGIEHAAVCGLARHRDLFAALPDAARGNGFVDDAVARVPLARIVFQHENATIGAGDQSTVRRLIEREHVAADQAGALLQPVLSTITGDEHAAFFLVVDYADVDGAGVVIVGQNGRHIAMRVTVVRGSEGLCAVIAGQHAPAVGRQQNARRVARIHHHVVHYQFRIADPLPGLALIHRFPEAFGGSGVNDIRVAWVLFQHASATRREGDALNLLK